jgi:hypothetical protein
MVSWQERIGVGQQNHSGHSVLHLQQGLGFNKSPQCGRRAHLAPRKRSVKPLLKQSAWRLSGYSALRLLAIHSRTWCSLRATKELQRSYKGAGATQNPRRAFRSSYFHTYIHIYIYCFQLFPNISIYVLICSFFCSCVYRLCLRCCVAELRTKMVHQKRRRNPLQCEGLPLWPRITLAMDSSIAPTYGNLRFPHSIWTLTVHSLYIPKTFPKGSKREPKIWAVWVHKKNSYSLYFCFEIPFETQAPNHKGTTMDELQQTGHLILVLQRRRRWFKPCSPQKWTANSFEMFHFSRNC